MTAEERAYALVKRLDAEALALGHALLDELRQVRELLEAQQPSRGLFVKPAAKRLGVSESMLRRVIAQLPESKRPAVAPSVRADGRKGGPRRYFWADEQALLDWWESISETHAEPKSPPVRRQVRGEAVQSWAQVAREVARANREEVA